MQEYGYINDGGYLRSRVIEEYKEQYLDGTTLKTRVVTEQEQIESLIENGWKPVDAIDQSKLSTDDGYIIRIEPYDDGARIKFRYVRVYDVQRTRSEMKALQDSLTASDYKIIKCYEASLAGEELPYDFAALRAERQAKRDRFNELEAEISAHE